MESEDTQPSLDHVAVDLANLELNQRKLEIELKMKRNQVKQLRELEDSQSIKIQQLEKELSAKKAKISELEFELEITKNTCASYNTQLRNTGSLQQKAQYEKLIIENESLKELLQQKELDLRKVLRQIQDLTSLHLLDTNNKKECIEKMTKNKALMEKMQRCFKELEREFEDIKALKDRLLVLTDAQEDINTYKQIAKEAMTKRDEMEENCVYAKAKLDALTHLLDNYPIPQASPSADFDEYKEQVEKLRKALDDERTLTIRQNERLSKEVVQNAVLALRVDSLERDLTRPTKCMKDMCLQTEN